MYYLLFYKVLEEASSSGLALEVENNFPPVEEKWSILQAVFFSSTVLTTIGVYEDVSIIFLALNQDLFISYYFCFRTV